jgi:epoxyqueuosine reductase QueG
MKNCYKCGVTKPLDAFNKNKSKSDGLASECRRCQKLQKIKALEQDYLGVRLKERRNNLRRMFGISIEEYDEKLANQGGGCQICGLACVSGKRLAVDHDHKTGKIRDLLCNNCNGGLGKFQDNPELLIKAADYLRKHSG